MRALFRIKEEMEFMEGMGEIVDAFKTAAMMRFRLFQGRAKINEAFFEQLSLAAGLAASHGALSRYFYPSDKLPAALLVITSDEGFLGELNATIVNRALDQRSGADDLFIVMGERGARYLDDAGQPYRQLEGISEKLEASQVSRLCDLLIKEYGVKYSRLSVVYPEFISLSEQKAQLQRLLPYSDASAGRAGRRKGVTLIEPSAEQVMDTLVELLMYYRLTAVFWSSKQSEYAARIMHLENGSQELVQIRRALRADYFKQIHTMSDTTIREISAAKTMMRK